MATPARLTRRQKLAAFGPFLVVAGTLAAIASGASLMASAGAASTTVVNVNGTVSSTLNVDPTLTAGGGATGCFDESLTNFATAFAKSNGCQLSFTSNEVNGARVTFENNNPATDAAFFCDDADGAGPGARSCASDADRLEDVTGTLQKITDGSDTFGLNLTGVGGTGTSSTSTTFGSGTGIVEPNPVGGTAVTATASFAQIPANGSPASSCTISKPNLTTSTCDFVFGGSGKAGQQVGSYSGTMLVSVVAN